MKFILNTFSELATGHKDDLKIRTLSSSGLMVFLAAGYGFAAIVAKAVDFIVGQYKQILEIKKLQLELDRLELPEEISEKTREHANSLMEKSIEKFTIEIVNEYHSGKDGERKNELRNAVKISLNKIANKIDHGFNFEVRIEPPKAFPKGEEGEKIGKAVETIQAAAENMQYMKLEGPPILALPEKDRTPPKQETDSKETKQAKKEPGKEHQAIGPPKLDK